MWKYIIGAVVGVALYRFLLRGLFRDIRFRFGLLMRVVREDHGVIVASHPKDNSQIFIGSNPLAKAVVEKHCEGNYPRYMSGYRVPFPDYRQVYDEINNDGEAPQFMISETTLFGGKNFTIIYT